MELILIFLFPLYIYGAKLVSHNNYVVDKTHNLIWQDTKDNISLSMDHSSAIKYCQDLTFLGYKDWVLPTREHYSYIIDKTRKDQPKIDKSFQFVLPDEYWSSDTTWRNFGRYGYYIFLKSGAVYYNNKSYKKLVRCVREN